MRSVTPGSKPHEHQACEACRRELSDILDSKSLLARFQPVASLVDCGVFGYIASVRGPADSMLRSEERLYTVADWFGRLHDLACLSFDEILGRFVQSQVTGTLVIPLERRMVEALGSELAVLLEQSLKQARISIARLLVIHPGVSCGDDNKMTASTGLIAALQRLGVGLAAGNIECGPSEALLWSGSPVNLATLGKQQLEGLDPNLVHGSRLHERLREQLARGRKVLALGVNGLNELRVAQALGVDLVAGDFLGKPHTEPARTFSAAAVKAIRDACPCGQPQTVESRHLLERLLVKAPPVPPETTAEKVFAMFEDDADLRAIAVVRDGYPVGLIARYHLVDNMARPFRLEVYGKKPCTRFMDAEPLTMDIRLSLPELAEQVVHANPRHLISGFIMTEGGRYVGMGTVQDLVREITSMQMEAARYANPLTQLPGNVPINQHLDQLLGAREHCTVCYGDLDHFKPFNDVYGYAKGDEVILLTARILAEVCDADRDFIGHLGGDDFVLIFRSADWEARCRRALKRFEEEIVGFFSHDDIERGGYVTENRKGDMEFHALTSLSIGAAAAPPAVFPNHLAIAAVAAEVKKKAKAIKGNSLYINQRNYSDTGP